jgi:hypothetical protein
MVTGGNIAEVRWAANDGGDIVEVRWATAMGGDGAGRGGAVTCWSTLYSRSQEGVI